MCLEALCRSLAANSSTADAVPVQRLRRPADPRALDWLAQQGLVERRDDTTVALPPEYQPCFSYMLRQVRRLAAILRRLTATPMPRGKSGILRRGLALFDGGLFFECHEYFEDIWRAAPAGERGFYHGVILVAAAFYHYEKGNLHGARVKLSSGVDYLLPLAPVSHGVRLDRWLARLEPWKTRIEAGLPAGVLKVSEVPKIPLTRARRHE
jgi:hypothetical protein